MIGTSAALSEFHPATMSDGTFESTMALIQRVREGDDQALNDLCARYLPRLERWARGRLPASARGTTDTQDLAQLTITQVARHVHRFVPNHEGSFQAYVRQALLNQIRSQIRAAARKGPPDPLEDDHPSPQPSPLEQAIGQELLDRYDEALERLKPSDREAIIARVEMGLNWSEAAEALDKNTPSAAQMTVSRALVRLAKEMAHDQRR
jgi:RNA polymerase sigma-70 factor, ECF subfamily